MNILHIDASSSDDNSSHSRKISAQIVAKLKEKHPDATVTRRDVDANRPPHVDVTIRDAWQAEGEKSKELSEIGARSKELVDELKAADILVIGSPMYNFTVPSTLKAWIDNVAIAGQTFEYTEKGPQGLLSTKAYFGLSSGGVYTQGPATSANHLSTYLTSILGLMAIETVGFAWAEGNAMGPEMEEKAMAAAMDKVDALIAA